MFALKQVQRFAHCAFADAQFPRQVTLAWDGGPGFPLATRDALGKSITQLKVEGLGEETLWHHGPPPLHVPSGQGGHPIG